MSIAELFYLLVMRYADVAKGLLFDLCSEVRHMLHGNKSDGLRLQDVYEHDSMRVVS